MTINIEDFNIYLKPGVTDMRKGAGKLAVLVKNEMNHDPYEKSIFIFCGRTKRVIKALFWDDNGWFELIKRLECGASFKYPDTAEASMQVTIEQIKGMLAGNDVWRKLPSFKPELVG
jgi:Transposase and inactivated derivatives